MEEKVKRKNIRHSEIIKYWGTRLFETEYNFDFSEADTICWGCGYERKLQGAHIIPHCLGGKSEPSNLVLLCSECNRENPHCESQEDFFNWLKAKKRENLSGLYNRSKFYVIRKEFKTLYGYDMFEKLGSLFENSELDLREEFNSYADENSSKHYFSNNATYCVFFKNFIESISKKIGVYNVEKVFVNYLIEQSL